jgi:hypothetical protein
MMLPTIKDQDDVRLTEPQMKESIRIACSVYQKQQQDLTLQGEVMVRPAWRNDFQWRYYRRQVATRIKSKGGDWLNGLDWNQPIKMKAVLNADPSNRVADKCIKSDPGYTLGLEVRGTSISNASF